MEKKKDLGKVTTEEEKKAQADKLPFYKNWRFYVYTFIALCLSFLAISSLLNGCSIREVQKQEETKVRLCDQREPNSAYSDSWTINCEFNLPSNTAQTFNRFYYFNVDSMTNGAINASFTQSPNYSNLRFWFTYDQYYSYFALVLGDWNYYNPPFFDSATWTFEDGTTTTDLSITGRQYKYAGVLKSVSAVSTDNVWNIIYNSALYNYNLGYSSGYSEGYLDGTSDGYSSGYSEGYNDGSSDGYSSGYSVGYSTGYSSGVDYGENIVVSGEFYLGQKLESVLFPVDFNAQDVYNDLYTGSEFQRAEIQFDDGSYIERFERVSSVGDLPYRQVGYRYLYNNGAGIVPFFSVIRQTTDDNTVTYIRMVQNNGGVGRLVFADYGATSAKVVNFLYYMQQHKSVSQLTPGVENGYAQGYADGSSVGYRNGLNDANPSALTETLAVVFQQPFNVIWRFLNFNVLGLNLLALACGLITLFIVLKVVKKII